MTESFKGVQPHPTAIRTDTASPRKSAQETVRNADDELELAHRPTPREISVIRFDAQRRRRVEIKIDAQDYGNVFVVMPKGDGAPTFLRLRY